MEKEEYHIPKLVDRIERLETAMRLIAVYLDDMYYGTHRISEKIEEVLTKNK